MGGFIGGNMLAGAMKKFRGAGGGGYTGGNMAKPVSQSGTGGPSLGSPGAGWGQGMAGGGIKKLRQRMQMRRRLRQGTPSGQEAPAPAPAPTPGGSTIGRRARRQRMAQMGRPQPPQATTAPDEYPNMVPPAGFDPGTQAGFDPTLMTDPTTGQQYPPGTTGTLGAINMPGQGQAAGSALPPMSQPVPTAQQPVPTAQPAGASILAKRKRQLGGGWGQTGWGAGMGQTGLWNPEDASAGRFGGPEPMAPAPGPASEPAPIGGADRFRRGMAGRRGGWGGVLGLGG